MPDFLEARRVAVLLDELVQVVENLALPFGEREHATSNGRTICKGKAKVKGIAKGRRSAWVTMRRAIVAQDSGSRPAGLRRRGLRAEQRGSPRGCRRASSGELEAAPAARHAVAR